MNDFPIRDIILKNKVYSKKIPSLLEETRDTLNLLLIFAKRERPQFTLLSPSELFPHTEELSNSSGFIVRLLSQHLLSLLDRNMENFIVSDSTPPEHANNNLKIILTSLHILFLNQNISPGPLDDLDVTESIETKTFHLFFDPSIFSTNLRLGPSSPFSIRNIHFIDNSWLFVSTFHNADSRNLSEEIIISSLKLLTFLLEFSHEIIDSDLPVGTRGQYADSILRSIFQFDSQLLEILYIYLGLANEELVGSFRSIPDLPSPSIPRQITEEIMLLLGTIFHSPILSCSAIPNLTFYPIENPKSLIYSFPLETNSIPDTTTFSINCIFKEPPSRLKENFNVKDLFRLILSRTPGSLSLLAVNKIVKQINSFLGYHQYRTSALTSLALTGSKFVNKTLFLLTDETRFQELLSAYDTNISDSFRKRNSIASFLLSTSTRLYAIANMPIAEIQKSYPSQGIMNQIPNLMRLCREEKNYILKAKLIYSLANLMFFCRSTVLLQNFGMCDYFITLITQTCSLTFSIQLTASCLYLLSIVTLQESLVQEFVSLGLVDILMTILNFWTPDDYIYDILHSSFIVASWKKSKSLVLLYSLSVLLNILSSDGYVYRKYLLLSTRKTPALYRLLEHPNENIRKAANELICRIK